MARVCQRLLRRGLVAQYSVEQEHGVNLAAECRRHLVESHERILHLGEIEHARLTARRAPRLKIRSKPRQALAISCGNEQFSAITSIEPRRGLGDRRKSSEYDDLACTHDRETLFQKSELIAGSFNSCIFFQAG